MKFSRIDHVALEVADLQHSADFYSSMASATSCSKLRPFAAARVLAPFSVFSGISTVVFIEISSTVESTRTERVRDRRKNRVRDS